MKLRHPISGAVYTQRADGQVEVEHDGKIGFFKTDGQYVRGDVHFADPHMLNWLQGEGALPNRRTGSVGIASAADERPAGVGLPKLGSTSTRIEGRTGHMDLGLSGRKALVTASTRGIGLAIAQTYADEGRLPCSAGP